jgi:serine O-acetyltransferase
MTHPFLNHKGFHALQAHRIAHRLWCNDRKPLARHMQSRMSEVFAVDIHPAARLGAGLFIDHATGVVIGETTVVGDDVSILQGVTLGGTGKRSGDRHPKIGPDVLLCAGAKVLGNIRIGRGAKVGSGSVVLKDVPAHTTVVGVPARVVGRPRTVSPSVQMEHLLDSECL